MFLVELSKQNLLQLNMSAVHWGICHASAIQKKKEFQELKVQQFSLF